MLGRILVDCVVGARPNFIKMAALLDSLQRCGSFAVRLIHTGQHYSPEMSDQILNELGLPSPDANLGVSGGTSTTQTAEIMLRLEPLLLANRPAAVIVVGDVNSTVASAMVAVRNGIAVVHVEAGLRSFDRTMPEEINRILTDSIADFLFVSEPSGIKNLMAEGIAEDRIVFAGNVMIDTLLRFRDRAAQSDVLTRLKLAPRSYGLVTLHRAANVDEPERLRGLFGALERIAAHTPLVFPMHPRTQARMAAAGLVSARIHIVPPLGYLDFVHLMSHARLVLTDSGGVQEETTILRVPCLTLRNNTERPVTIEQGTNRLAGVEPEGIVKAADDMLGNPPLPVQAPPLWDGRAGDRIARYLEHALGATREKVKVPADIAMAGETIARP
jgi:UDP-N-acetylglucosamine 2-epimerase (non-hydrolysing)